MIGFSCATISDKHPTISVAMIIKYFMMIDFLIDDDCDYLMKLIVNGYL